MRLSKFILFGFVFIAGCSAMEIEEFKDKKPMLVLKDFFSGKLKASGAFFSRSGEISTRFTIDADGAWDGKKLTLNEQLRYESGEVHHRTFEITKMDADHYTVDCSEFVGEGTIEAQGNALHWRYKLKEHSAQAKDVTLSFDDWMFLNNDGKIVNRAFATKLGFDAGNIFLTMEKVP